MWHTKNAFFREMQFWSHCYTVVSYQALFRLSVCKIPAVYLSGAKNACFCTIRDFGSPTIGQIYPTELQLNKANSSDTEAPFLDLSLSITNGIVSSKIYDKQDDFNFEIVNFPFLDGDVPRSPSYGIYISQLIRFARVCSNVDDFEK